MAPEVTASWAGGGGEKVDRWGPESVGGGAKKVGEVWRGEVGLTVGVARCEVHRRVRLDKPPAAALFVSVF